MQKYCRSCLHNGDAFCELPSVSEQVRRNVWYVVATSLEAMVPAGLPLTDFTVPIEKNGFKNSAKADLAEMRKRVVDCIITHQNMEAEGLLGDRSTD
jgi:hypothetical protein